MKKRLVIGISILVLTVSGVCGCSLKESTETSLERQEYANNAYKLGLAEALAVMVMPVEEAAKVQEIVHQAMEQELSLEEQEQVLDKVFELLNEYITTEKIENYL